MKGSIAAPSYCTSRVVADVIGPLSQTAMRADAGSPSGRPQTRIRKEVCATSTASDSMRHENPGRSGPTLRGVGAWSVSIWDTVVVVTRLLLETCPPSLGSAGPRPFRVPFF